jgi:futalosine hydrolase
MEGFSLALVATVHNVPFLEVRAASNRAGSRRAEDWDLERAFDTLSKLAQTLFSRDG